MLARDPETFTAPVRLTLVGERLGDVAELWQRLASLFGGADLIETDDVVRRACRAAAHADYLVVILDATCDIDGLPALMAVEAPVLLVAREALPEATAATLQAWSCEVASWQQARDAATTLLLRRLLPATLAASLT